MRKYALIIVLFLGLLLIACSSEEKPLIDGDSSEQLPDEDSVSDVDEDEIVDNLVDLDVDEIDESVNDSDDDESIDETPDDDFVPQNCEVINGIYSLVGEDENGTYSGQAEIKDDHFIRLITYDSYTFEDKKAALALEGALTVATDLFSLDFSLEKIGFVTRYKELVRDTADVIPLHYTGNLQKSSCGVYSGSLTAGAGKTMTETWTRSGESEENPLWQNLRIEIDQMSEPSDSDKLQARQLYSSFYDLERIIPYLGRYEFNRMVHLMVVDHTDYEFYQTKPGVVRVIQKVVDPISLAEAWMRNDAYRYTFAEKEAYFNAEIKEIMINPLGMIAHKRGDEFFHDGDSLLWTGNWATANAMKYIITNDETARDAMVESLEGIIACLEITPDPSADFGRTIRITKPHLPDPEFIQGVGDREVNGYKYSEIEWKINGNNDMAKGPFIGFIWGLKVLWGKPEYQYLIDKMFNALKRMRDNHSVYKDGQTNQVLSDLILAAFYTQKGEALKAQQKILETSVQYPIVKEYYQSDESVINQNGVSDWSGNHLGIWGAYNFVMVNELLGRDGEANDFRNAMQNMGERLEYSRTGLYQMMTAGGGVPQDEYNLNDSFWRLREMGLHRGKYAVDWQINPSFCLSPVPALPWKNDWTSPTENRTQSIRAYPYFQKSNSSYLWKDNILDGYRGGGSEHGDSGLDFFVAYWFGQYNGLIPD